MKPNIAIYFYVVLLVLIIHGEKTLFEYSNEVAKIAKDRGLINGIFQPLGMKPLGMGVYSFAYRGLLLPIQMEIAMKFTRQENFIEAEDEYRMYSYLEAINNTNVERYGIPSVYYSGHWNDLMLTGITLLDENVQDLVNSKQIFGHEVNLLIIIRDFILASKYMHSHGVRHDDIKLQNILVRRNRAFLIDFNISSKMNQMSESGTMDSLSRRGHGNGERYPKDDWESFLYSICAYALGVKFPWIGLTSEYEIQTLKENTANTIKLIEGIKSKQLRTVLLLMAQHTLLDDGGEFESDGEHSDESDDDSTEYEPGTFHHENDEKRFPEYDFFYNLVNDMITKSNLPKPVMFSWLTPNQKNGAIADLKKFPVPDITKINDPKHCNYLTMKYPDVDPDKFTRAYKDWTSSSSSNKRRRL